MNTAVEEEGEEPDNLPDDADIKEYLDFSGQNHFNIGQFDDEPDDDDTF